MFDTRKNNGEATMTRAAISQITALTAPFAETSYVFFRVEAGRL